MADNYTVVNSCGVTITMKSIEVSTGVQAVQSIPTDTVGAAMVSTTTPTSAAVGQTVVLSPNSAKVPTYLVPVSSAAGLTRYSVIVSSGTNSTLISSAARQVYKIEAFSNSSAIGYLKLYNLSSAPTAGSSLVAARFMVSQPGFITTTDIGEATFTTGLSYTFTGGIADSDTTAVSASQFILNILYK